MLAHERARGTCVVEVDVREQEVADVLELEPAGREAFLQRRDAGGRAAVVEDRAVGRVDHVAADGTLEAAEVQVDRVRRRHGRAF